MNRMSVPIFGERIAWGKRRNGTNTARQRTNDLSKESKNAERKESSTLLDNCGGEKETNSHAGTPGAVVPS
jgi:hypothetical protein